MKDYYKEINDALLSYEEKPYHTHSIEWIGNRIDWCYTFGHITKEQMENFVDRFINIMNNERSA